MSKKVFITLFLSSIFFVVFQTACATDKLPEPEPPALCDTLKVSYNLQVKEIIDTNCSIPTCHRAGTAAPGNYTSFNSIQPFLTDREFKSRVVDMRNDPEFGMPPNYEENPGPKDLTQEEFDILTCWIEAGYPED